MYKPVSRITKKRQCGARRKDTNKPPMPRTKEEPLL